MKKSKKKKDRSAKSRKQKILKVSEMILNYAGDFIRLGDTLEERQSYLNAACSAWNIAILPEKDRDEAVDLFIEQYKIVNPGIDDTEGVRHDVELLIKEKLRLYPNERKSIANAEIIDESGQERIIVASIKKPR